MSDKGLLDDEQTQNWVKSALGLKYLKGGLETFVDNLVRERHAQFSFYITKDNSRSLLCKECTWSNLLPDHAIRQIRCPFQPSKRCLCSNLTNRRACPDNGECGLLYDYITDDHVKQCPTWKNVCIERWSSHHWEMAKGYICSPGYIAKESIVSTDVVGILSICLENKHVRTTLNNKLATFEKAKEVRNEILHSGDMQVDKAKLEQYASVLTKVLKHRSIAKTKQKCVEQALDQLKNLSEVPICKNCTSSIEVRIDALEAIASKKEEIMGELQSIQDFEDSSSLQFELAKLLDAETKHKKDLHIRKLNIQQTIQTSEHKVDSIVEKQKRYIHSLQKITTEDDLQEDLKAAISMDTDMYESRANTVLKDIHFADLEEKGYTVVEHVVLEEDCDLAIAEYRKWLEYYGDGFPSKYASLITGCNIAHMESTWNIRLKTRKVFAELWKTEKLLTSFDAISIGKPPDVDVTQRNKRANNRLCLHVDMSSSRRGLHAYQGGVYLEEQTESDWVFNVIEGTHKIINEYFDKHPQKGKMSRQREFYNLTDDVEEFIEKGYQLVRVPVPKGGMVIWDSRVIHANSQPLQNRVNVGRWRYVVFVSMTPAIWATELDLKKRREAYELPTNTTHWSSQGVRLIPPDITPGIPIPTSVPDIARTDNAMKLSGMIPYDFEDGQSNGGSYRPVWEKDDDEGGEAGTY